MNNDSFSINEIDEDETTRVVDAVEMARILNIPLFDYIKQREEQKVHDEFWADSCWSE